MLTHLSDQINIFVVAKAEGWAAGSSPTGVKTWNSPVPVRIHVWNYIYELVLLALAAVVLWKAQKATGLYFKW